MWKEQEFNRVVERGREGRREEKKKMKREFREVCRLRLVTPVLWFETGSHKALPVPQELPFCTELRSHCLPWTRQASRYTTTPLHSSSVLLHRAN